MLETALLSTRPDERAHSIGRSLPAIVALHGAVVLVFVAASVWKDGEPPEPAIPVVFGRFASPPPPLGNGTPQTVRPRTTGPKALAAVPVRIERLPDATSVQPAPVDSGGPEVGETDPGSAEDGGGGSPHGIPGGTGDAPASDLGGNDDLPRPGGAISFPVLVQRVDPEYPDLARRARQEGTVMLDAVITELGAVDDVTILKSAGALLDDAAARAVRRWSYRPALLDGRAVRVRLTVTVTFALRGA